MTPPTRRRALELLAGTGALALAGIANAQAEKTVRFILPNATGSGVDAITRSAQAARVEELRVVRVHTPAALARRVVAPVDSRESP